MRSKHRVVNFLAAAALCALPAAAQETHGINAADMDTSKSACQDFFHYANGGWIAAHPIPAEYPSWGTFNQLAEENREKLRGILEGLSKRKDLAPGSDEQKLSDFWSTCMDQAAVEAAGASPIEPELSRIAAIASRSDLEAEIARLQQEGVGVLFDAGSQQDRKNSEEVILGLYQGGLGLPDRDYYLKTDEKSQTIRQKYIAHVTTMLGLLGDPASRAASEAADVMQIETALAKASMTRVERRDPDKTYNRMNEEELQRLAPAMEWARYLREVKAPPVTAINVGQPDFFREVDAALSGFDLPMWRSYLRWHLVDAAAPYLSSKFVDENFAFKGKTLQGTEKIEERWKRCVSAADRQLGFALGREYVAKYFPPEAKKRADEMVHNLIEALGADIQTLDWMSEPTKKAAIEKLHAFTPKIGYPDKWRDYSKYAVDRSSFAGNVLRGAEFEFHRDLDKIGKPVDRTEWGMTPPTVNAYYNPAKNEIVFPAGILQRPFFDAQADDAVNYGAIGAVIGHEMTHGFDDQGRKFDAKGNLHDWWTPQDAKNYEARAKCVEHQFDAYVVSGNVHENGKLVLGESIADLGGLTIAYKAYHAALAGKPAPVIGGLTGDQRFFLSFAHVWAGSDRPQFELLMANLNPHPLGRYRAIAAPSNMPPFAKAFGCSQGSPMVRQEQCRIW